MPSASATPTPSVAAKPLRITSVVNFRDVAGSGLEVAGGGRMALGVVYRSARLAGVSAADSRALSKAGVELVIDLRTDSVAARRPDPVVRGATNRLVNLIAAPNFPAMNARTSSAAQAYMRQLNVDFVDLAGRRRQIARVLELIAAADGPVLIHCTEGKDRTGWISALLQLTAGASRTQAVTEYVKSNSFRAATINAGYRARLTSSGRAAAGVELALTRVRPDYLGAGLAEIDAKYGGISGYLTKGLGLSTATVKRLQARLTA